MSKHTPGPWSVHAVGDGSYGEDDVIGNWVRGPATLPNLSGMVVAAIVSDCVSEHDANARLIAQAPTLLTDLTDAAAQLRKLGGEVNAALAARFEATIAAAVGGAE